MTDGIIRTGKLTALFSFTAGSILMLLFYITLNAAIIIPGYLFTFVALGANILVFSLLLSRAIKDKVNRVRIFRTCGFMLMNVPVMVIYFMCVTMLLGTIKITFSNATNTRLTDLRITGCEEQHITKLDPEESATVPVRIPNDCALYITYTADGHTRTESVTGYITWGMCQRISFDIGVGQKPMVEELTRNF